MRIFNFFGRRKRKVQDFKNRGAVIVDVRSPGEFNSGSIPGSRNIPLEQIQSRIKTIQNWKKPVICYCASGMRSAGAASLLRSSGVEAMNGGGISGLMRRLG